MGLSSTQALAENVTGMIVPLSGHWIPEEQPEFVIKQLANFFNQEFLFVLQKKQKGIYTFSGYKNEKKEEKGSQPVRYSP